MSDINSILVEFPDNANIDNINQTQYKINELVSKVGNLLKTTAVKIGMRVNKNSNRTRRRKQPHKTWYNTECEHLRKYMIKCKNKYKQQKSDDDLQELRSASRRYKRQINSSFRQYHKTLAKKLRLLKSNNAKEYWQIINGTNHKETTQKLSIDVLKDHFKKLNYANNNNPENQRKYTNF